MKPLKSALILGAAMIGTVSAIASSHREAPLITGTPKLDGADFYMFNSYEAGRSNFVTFVADYLPLQDPYGGPNYFTLETNGVYDILIDNNGDAMPDITFQFQFWTTYNNISLTIGPAGNQVTNSIPLVIAGQIFPGNNSALNVTENYSVKMITGSGLSATTQYLTNAANGSTIFTKPVDNIGTKTIPDYLDYANQYIYSVNIPGCATPGRLFVGQRKDPFVVNLGETFDLINYANVLGPMNGAINSLANKNVTSLILELPKTCLTNGASPVIGAWTTASKYQSNTLVQVSRLGQPLVNEVVIGLKDKDNFNASQPVNDGQFANYVEYPTLPALIQILYGADGVVAPTNFPRLDLVEVFLTGIPGLNQTATAAEYLRLNTSTPATPYGAQSDLGVLGGDYAGFPNGRRPGDDVVTAALRVMMGVLLSTNVAPSGQLPYTDGAYVDSTFFSPAFPYIMPPIAGSPNPPSVTITMTGSPTVGGPYTPIPATYNSNNATLTTSTLGTSNGFYRVSSSRYGVVLGQPKLSGTNVTMGITTPQNAQ